MIAWLRNNLKFELQIFTRIVLKNKLDLKLGRHAFAGVAAESFIAVGVDPARFDGAGSFAGSGSEVQRVQSGKSLVDLASAHSALRIIPALNFFLASRQREGGEKAEGGDGHLGNGIASSGHFQNVSFI